MFEGRSYRQTGWEGRTVRFADVDGAVATCTYSYKLTSEERAEMARRIAAALNLVRNLAIDQIECLAPIQAPTRCHAGRDGEPDKTGRHCPIDFQHDED